MDAGHAYTDDEIERLEKRINEAYSQAYSELQAKQSEFFREYEALRQEQLALLEEGTITKAQFNANMTRSMQTEKWYKQMISTYADQLTYTDKMAAGMINGSLSNVFAENMDFGTYQVETGSGVNTMYTLTDAQTVTNLIKNEPNLLPTLEIDGKKATRWHKQTVTSAITQSVLQGESVTKAAKRLQSVAGMSASAARTNARTALNSAQNSGRQKSYERAQGLGLEFKKMWLATVDGRTRSSHRVADGQTVGVDEMFEVGSCKMEHPGDAQNGRPEELYNCRCTVVAVFNDEQRENLLGIRNETSELLKGQSYDEWKNARKKSAATAAKAVTNKRTIAEGSDIVSSWKRNNDFEFQIQDVIHAQGFDGVPKIVSAADFDAAVEKSKFVAQRSYSATTKEIADSYRDMLYRGSWYVDCSNGGSQYGQGMYCASNYEGIISSGMVDEMTHYHLLSAEKLGGKETTLKYKLKLIEDYANDAAGGSDRRKAVSTYLKVKTHLAETTPEERKATKQLLSRNDMKVLNTQSEIINQAREGTYTYIETMTLDPSAKIADFDEIKKEHNEYLKQHSGSTEEYIEDVGTYAAAKGYDAMNVSGRGASGSYTVILNRTKLLIREQ